MMRPDAHRVMAKNDSLLAQLNFGQGTPGHEEILELSRDLVMISVNEMDRLAAEALAVGRDLFNAAHAKIPKEIERIVLLDVCVHPIQDERIHLFRARKRTIAVADDVEVPEVKIGREPRVGHISIMKDRLLERRLYSARIRAHTREDTTMTTGPADLGRATVSQDEPQNRSATSRLFFVKIVQAWNDFDMEVLPLHTVAGTANWPDSVWAIGEAGNYPDDVWIMFERLVPDSPQDSWASVTLRRNRCLMSRSVQPFPAHGGTRPACLPRPACALAQDEHSAQLSWCLCVRGVPVLSSDRTRP